jgi:hypothetical protein
MLDCISNVYSAFSDTMTRSSGVSLGLIVSVFLEDRLS